MQAGLQQAQQTVLRERLEVRFRPLSRGAQHHLENLRPERLEAMAVALLKAQSLEGLGLED